MPLSTKLNRTLRAEEEDTDDEEYYEVTDRSSPSVIDTGDGADIISSGSEDEQGEGAQEEEDQSDESDEDQYEARLSKVSFGALAKAQESLSKEQSSRKRKRDDGTSTSQEDKLQALRERLQALKAEKLAAVPTPKSSKKLKTSTKTSAKAKPTQDEEDEDQDQASDGDSSDSGGAPFARSSKHAPRVQSSKRAVTRRRTAVEVKKPVFRDPRFDQLSGIGPNENTLKNRYSFLDEYRASEMADLRATIKKTKNEAEKAQLKRQLLSMESQQKAREAKDKQQEVVQRHKKQEKELIKEGKQPFYLKKAEQKKLALIDRFQNMKSKQRAHVIERRRKKTTAKERKNIPADRRAA